MRMIVFVSFLLAACGGSGVTGVMVDDLARPPVDLSMPTTGSASCQGILTCLNGLGASGTQDQFNACVATGTAQAQSEFGAFDTCLNNACGSLPTTGGSGSCGNQTTCTACVQTGTSSTNQSNGSCVNMQGGTTVNDPLCGTCVDQLLACGM